MNRKQRRELKKKGGDTKEVKTLNEKISQIFSMPQECSACKTPFEKKNKDMVTTWSVVVRGETVRLFCPACIGKTQRALSKE